jgi:hypothetical protein
VLKVELVLRVRFKELKGLRVLQDLKVIKELKVPYKVLKVFREL